MVRRIAFVLVVALTLRGTAAAVAAPSAEARLHALQKRYRSHVRASRPDLASGAGDSQCADRLEPLTESSLEADARLLSALADSVSALERMPLAERDRAALAELSARMAREAAPLREGVWRRDPGAYRALVHDAVMRSAGAPRVSVCERERRALHRLRAVPELLRAAAVNLGAGATFDPDSEAVRWTAALVDLRVTLPGRFSACHDGDRYADFVEADSLALGAARDFMARLRARSQRAPAN